MLESLFNKNAGLKVNNKKTPEQRYCCRSGVFIVNFEACATLLKRPQHMFFPVNIANLLRTPLSINICKRLLLEHICMRPFSIIRK